MEKPVESWKKACLNEVKAKVTFRVGNNGKLKPNPGNQIMQNLIKGEGEIGERGDNIVMVKHRVEGEFINQWVLFAWRARFHLELILRVVKITRVR
jgi:hypothetical protein